MAKKIPYSLKTRVNPKAMLLQELSKLRVSLRLKELQHAPESEIEYLRKQIAEKARKLETLQ